MVKLSSVELSAPFKLEPRKPVFITIKNGIDCKDIELNETTGVITITTGLGKVYTSLSNAKAAYGVTETTGNTLGASVKKATK